MVMVNLITMNCSIFYITIKINFFLSFIHDLKFVLVEMTIYSGNSDYNYLYIYKETYLLRLFSIYKII